MNMQQSLTLVLLVSLTIASVASGNHIRAVPFSPGGLTPNLTTDDSTSIDLSPVFDWIAEGDQAAAEFGYSVGTAGDVNGDGYDDVIVGAPRYDNGVYREGAVFVFHGSPTGLSTSSNWTVGSQQTGARFGSSVGTAGDVNGDGYDDVIVGAYEYNNGQTKAGAVFVFHGSDTGLSTTLNWTLVSDQGSANLGISVGTAGDVNNDGYADVIVGAQWYTNDQKNEGAAFVFHGSETGLSTTADWMSEGDQASACFGASVGTAGDVNGDGYSDVIVGAHKYDNGQEDEGAVFAFYGSDSGLSTSHNWMAEGDHAGAQFGDSVGTAGDVNSDGYADVIVGAPLYDDEQANEGAVFVFHGSGAGLSASANWTAESAQEGALFGTSVGTAGDVNGDGYSDIIVGAYRFDDDEPDEGAAFVFHGSAAGLSASANWTAEGDKADVWFGYTAGTAGNVNGDSYADVIVGAPQYRHETEIRGWALGCYGPITGPGFQVYLPLVLNASP